MKSPAVVCHRSLTRVLGILLAVALIAGSSPVARALPEEAGVEARDVAIYVDGVLLTFDVWPRIYRDRLLVPMRAIFEKLGAEVAWEPSDRSISAKRRWLTTDLKIGQKAAMMNSEVGAVMDVVPVIVDDRTLVPLRFVSESLGARVEWDPATRTANIYMPPADKADLALAHPRGRISDPPGDYQPALEGSPPGGTFAFPAIDISKIIFATDSESLYVKAQMNGVIPSKPVTAEGFNEVIGLKIRIALNTDRNTTTGVVADKGAEMVLTYNANLQAGRETASFFSGIKGASSSATGTGTAFGNALETQYGSHRIGRLVEGGIGSDYVVLAYYLEDLGLANGQEFDVHACAAASTPNWSAFSYDEAPNREQRESITVQVSY